MDAKRILSEAWEAVQAVQLPEYLHAVALEQAVRLVACGSPANSAVVSPGAEASGPGAMTGANGPVPPTTLDDYIDPPGATLDEDEFFTKFAAESGVEEELLRGVYFVKAGDLADVRIGKARRLLGDSEAQKNRTVATLMAAIQWYVFGRANYGIGEIREAAKSVGYEPSRNLAKHLDRIPGTQPVGAGSDKAIRVQGSRFDAPFSELIELLANAN